MRHPLPISSSQSQEATAGGSRLAEADDDAPEHKLGVLRRALEAIRSGKINERNAASATIAELEGMGFGDAGGGRAARGGAHAATLPCAAIFGEALADGAPERATGVVCDFDPKAVTTDEKVLDLRVLFSRDFPLSVEQFLPVAEVMARTGRHAENFSAFFRNKMPAGAGFPVQFTIPAFPTITAKITFEQCEVRRAPPAAIFDLPADFAMGAYQERGWIRQL